MEGTQNLQTSRGQSHRIDWIDCAKGLVMFFVIIGHTVSETDAGMFTRGIIFSFHMPLYFILSCMTFVPSQNEEQFVRKMKKAFRHLIIPVFVTFALILANQVRCDCGLLVDKGFWRNALYTLVFSSGVETPYSSFMVPGLGMAWFLVVLFVGRTIYDYMQWKLSKELLVFACIVLSVLGVLLGQGQWLPFSLDIALAVMPFFYIGANYKRFRPETRPVKKLLLCLAVWLALYFISYPDWVNFSYMELACRRYSLYPLCFLCAAAGAFFFCELSVLMMRRRNVFRPLLFIGKNSLYLLCVHILDSIWKQFWLVDGREFYSALLRLVTDLAVFVVFCLVKYLVQRLCRKASA